MLNIFLRVPLLYDYGTWSQAKGMFRNVHGTIWRYGTQSTNNAHIVQALGIWCNSSRSYTPLVTRQSSDIHGIPRVKSKVTFAVWLNFPLLLSGNTWEEAVEMMWLGEDSLLITSSLWTSMIKLHDVPRDGFMKFHIVSWFMTSVFLCASCYLTIYILLLYASSVWMTRCTNYRSFLPRFEMDPAFDLKPVPSTAFSELNAAGCFSLVSIWKDWATSLGSKHKS